MRIFPIFVLVLIVGVLPAYAQSDQANPPTPDRSYKLLSEDEDWSFLRNPNLREDFWDPIKYIALRDGREDWYLTIGGEAREVWEQIGNDSWGQQPYMNGYFNERYMIHFDVHYGKHVRTFVELKSALNSFRIGGPRTIDEKKLDFQAAFLELGTSGDRNWIKLRVGRQEMDYGSGRFINVREGPNSRLSFDGFMVKSKIDSWQVDGFAMRPDLDKFGFFDNAPDHTVGFWGVYATRPLPRKHTLDVYYLGLNRKEATFERGTAQEVRHSLGRGFFSLPLLNGPDWTLTMRVPGSSALSVRETSRHGPSLPIPDIDSRQPLLNRGSAWMLTLQVEITPVARRSEHSTHSTHPDVTSASWHPPVPDL